MRWLKNLLVVTIITLATLLSSYPAQARCCLCDMTDNNMTEANRIVNNLSNHVTNEHDTTRQQIADFENRLIEWLDRWWDEEFRPSIEDLAEHWSTQILNHALMLATFYDAQNENLVHWKLQEEVIEAGRRNQPHELGCVAGTMSHGLMRTIFGARATRQALSIENLSRSQHHIQSGNTLDFGMTTDNTWRWEEYVAHYCDPNQNVAHAPAGCGGGGWSRPNADVLLSETLLENDTISNEEEFRSALSLGRNLIEPRILNPVTLKSLQGSDGKSYMAERRTQIARRMIGWDIFNSMIARRMPGSQIGPEARELLLQIGVPDSQAPAGWNPSYWELMGVITQKRFWDPEYYVRLQNSPENASRERSILTAFSLMQERDMYELQEQINLIAAAQLAAIFSK